MARLTPGDAGAAGRRLAAAVGNVGRQLACNHGSVGVIDENALDFGVSVLTAGLLAEGGLEQLVEFGLSRASSSARRCS